MMEMKEKKMLKIFDTIDGKQLVFKILNDLDEEKTMEIFKEAQASTKSLMSWTFF